MSGLPVVLQTTLLLVASNVFMTFAWRAHRRNLDDKPGWIAAPWPRGAAHLMMWGQA